MTFEEFMTILNEYATNTGLVLRDLENCDLQELGKAAWKLTQNVYREIWTRELDDET